jgi:signal transduction histidine kinase
MDSPLRRLPTWRSIDRRLVDAVAAVLLFAMMAVTLTGPADPGTRAGNLPAYVLAALITLPFALHRRHPEWALAVSSTALVGYGFGHFTAFPGYAAFALVFGIALHTGRGRGALAAGVTALALVVALSLQPSIVVNASTWVATLLAVTVAWLSGENLRWRRARWAALQQRAVRLESEREERARQAVTEERLRIARELHDVVAHSMSVIAVQAGVANHVIDTRPELARAALATVETNTRAALVEMRRLLGVLRQPDEPSASLVPTPGLGEVPRLVEKLAEAGLAVRVRVEGAPVGVPDGVDLSAFRIVQEGLTNVLRHGGPRAQVVIAYEAGLVRVSVGDDGRPAGVPSTGVRGPGHGLLGMRERVAVFGGTLTAGPRPDGGFDLVASLPYAQVAQAVDAGSAA